MKKNFKNNYILIIIIHIFAYSFFSCSDYDRLSMPKDFDIDFIYGYRGEYEVNTFNNTFKKALSWEKDTVFYFNLSNSKKELIYKQFVKHKFSEFSEIFEPESKNQKTGMPTYFIKIRYNGNTKKITWGNNTDSDEKKAKKLRNWFNFIIHLLEEEDAIKNLPDGERAHL